jgi:RNA polymerase-binding protein DksA
MRDHDRAADDLKEEFRGRLREARQALLRTVTTTDEELWTLEAPVAGAAGQEPPTDVAAAILSRLEGRERHLLDEIDAARGRLESGAFGVCERCGGAIALARLRALPTARSCIACQEHAGA